jgi:hypothetical protein
MRFVLTRVLVTCALLGSAAAGAHHSFAVHFVGDELITVTGVVTEFTFRNPHGLLTLEVVEKDGSVEQWRVETNSPNILRRRGWTSDSIKPGDEVTIEGFPARDGSNSMRIARVVLADGRELTGQRPAAGVGDSQD